MMTYQEKFERIVSHALLVMMASVAMLIIALIAAVIAMTRKIAVLDIKELLAETVLGIAAMLFGLTLGDYLVRRSRRGKVDLDSESRR